MTEDATTDDEIRFAVEAPDSDDSRAISAAFLADIGVRYPDLDTALVPTPAPAELRPPNGAWIVIRRAGEPVGCGAVRRLDAETGEVKRVYVAPSVRGRGVARRLMGRLHEEGRALGWKRIRLDTGDRQPEALSMYRSLGYREIDDYNGNRAASFWFEREL